MFVLVTGATLAYFLSVGALLPTLPLWIDGPLGGDEAAVGLVFGSFGVSALLLRPVAGALSDRHGRRLPMLVGAVLVAASVGSYGVVETVWGLVGLRLVGGAGEAFFYVAAATAVNDLAPDERRGEALSLFSIALYGGIALGPILGEAILHAVGFTPVWVAAASSAALAAVLTWPVPDTRPAEEPGPRPPLVHRAALAPGVVILVSVWGQAGFHAFVALHAREVGLPRTQLVFVTFAVVVLAVRSFGARLPDRLGLERVATASLVLSAAGAATIGAWTAPAGVYTGTAVFALGQAFAFPALMSIAVNRVPVRERGAVVGTFTAFVDLAFAVGGVSLGVVAAAAGEPAAFVVAAVISLLGLPVLLRLDPRRLRLQEVEDLGDVGLGRPEVADRQA